MQRTTRSKRRLEVIAHRAAWPHTEAMPWLQTTLISSTGRVVNEDHAGVAGDLAWVLDGAGLGQQPRFNAFATDAAWLVHEVSSWLTARATPPRPLMQLLSDLERHLAATFGEADTTDPAGGPTACLTVARLDGSCLELAWIADTVALVPRRTGQIDVVSDDRVTPFEAKAFATMHGLPRRDGELPDVARAQIRRNRDVVNRPEGFAAVSPTRAWTTFVRHARYDIDLNQPLVLMTDGMSRLIDTFHSLSPQRMHETCAAGGGNDLHDTLRRLEQHDPDATKHVRFKIHDDATLLVVRALPE